MISLSQLIDGSAEEMPTGELQRLYQIANSDGDSLALELIVSELEKKKTPSIAVD